MKAVVIAMLLAGVAHADDKQAKVDAAKTQTCEKGKKFLADQKAKGRCTAEADQAAKVTCSAKTFVTVNDLLKKCTAARPVEKPAKK